MNENSPVQHQSCSAGEAHLLVCRDKKGHSVWRGKNFINQREALIWTYLAEVLHPAVVPSQGQELRGAREGQAVTATRKSGRTWQKKREILTNSFALAFPFSDTKSSGVNQKKNLCGTRRRLWFKQLFLRCNTLSVGLSNHLAARLCFQSGCLNGKAWLTVLSALSYGEILSTQCRKLDLKK